MNETMENYYIMSEDGEITSTENPLEWAIKWELNRRIAFTKIAKNISVSTVFLGINHNFFSDGPPILFETMIFGGELDQQCWRYSTVKEAKNGHKRAVNMLKKK